MRFKKTTSEDGAPHLSAVEQAACQFLPPHSLFLFSLFLTLFFAACGATPAVAPAPLAEEAAAPAIKERVTWMGVYLSGAKIGWSRSSVEKVEQGRYRLRNETFMRLAAMGAVHESQMNLSVDFTPDYQPLSYRFSLKTPAFSTEAEGEVIDGVLTTRLKTPQSEREERISLAEGRDLFGLADLRRAAEGYKVGDVFEGEVFEPNLFIVVPYRIEVLDSETLRLGPKEETVFRIRMTMSGIESVSVIAADGEIIRSDGPMGITMKREEERTAKDLEHAGNVTDLILAFAIDADTLIPEAGRIRRAVMRVTGLDSNVPSGGAQKVSEPDSRGVRIVTVDLNNPSKDAAPDPNVYLSPSTHIQSDDPRIVARAREIVAGTAKPGERAERIIEWLHENMRQESAFTLPSAVDVLETMTGDCNEHAALFAGLARAAGIPTRVAVGVAYHKGRFYYHAWNEIWIEEHWMPIDATFNEMPAGALRVRLAVGDLAEQMRIAGMAGRIAISIGEAEP